MDVPTFLDLADAQHRLIEEVTATSAIGNAPLEAALGCVVAADVAAPIDIPHFDNSAMDGYAVLHADPAFATERAQLAVIGESFAGHPYSGIVSTGQCVRIFTGARIPEGATAVVMQEDATLLGDRQVRFDARPTAQQHIRHRGSDVPLGQRLFARGIRLTPAHLGLIASAGITSVSCYEHPRIGFFTNGDEIVMPGKSLGPGDIYDSNHHFLGAALRALPIEVLDLGHVRDDVRALENALSTGVRDCDAILTSGGVSVGEADLVGDVLARLGEVAFWKVAMKPGKPLLFGHLDDTPFFGLPGNPVSTVVTFLQLVRPALEKMCGLTPTLPWSIKATLRSAIDKSPGRLDFQRGVMSFDQDGSVTVETTGDQSSAILSSVVQANCLIVLPREQGNLLEGADVRVQPYSQFGL